jgi:hypothetical protein
MKANKYLIYPIRLNRNKFIVPVFLSPLQIPLLLASVSEVQKVPKKQDVCLPIGHLVVSGRTKEVICHLLYYAGDSSALCIIAIPHFPSTFTIRKVINPFLFFNSVPSGKRHLSIVQKTSTDAISGLTTLILGTPFFKVEFLNEK